jgi:anti-sigma-K factor RskA
MMIDTKSLLEKGLLEQYLLGELNAVECEQIEVLLVSDTELKTYLDRLDKDFENIGLENAIAPPAAIKAQILERISASKNRTAKVIELKNSNTSKFYLALAACIAALLMVSSFWMYSQLNDMKQQLQTVETDNTELNTTIEVLNTKLEETNTLYTAIVNPDTEQYILMGNTSLPEAKIVSYVNHNTKSIVINTERLPDLDVDHDYQMWADVEGEMIDMGVISKNKSLMAMTYIEHAESLNVTIEPLGGNDHPTVSRLVTNVYLR